MLLDSGCTSVGLLLFPLVPSGMVDAKSVFQKNSFMIMAIAVPSMKTRNVVAKAEDIHPKIFNFQCIFFVVRLRSSI